MKRLLAPFVVFVFLLAAPSGRAQQSAVGDVQPTPLPGTKPLRLQGDIASQLVDGVDRFLLHQLEQSIDRRAAHWKRDFSSGQAYSKSMEPNRRRLAHILGLRDARVQFDAPQLIATTDTSALVGSGDGFKVYAVRWPAVADMTGEGLLLVPRRRSGLADIVAIPDADQTPEQICGLTGGVPPEAQFARRLAESGARVLVPVLISRDMQQHRRAKLTHREFVYRSAFELGRHLIGYELQKVLAAVDWFAQDGSAEEAASRQTKIGVIGYGEGGMLALYAAALDDRIDVVCVSGYFDSRQNIWQQPLDRNVFGLLEQFGDAELAAMIPPRRLIVEASRGPELELPGQGGAPAQLTSPGWAAVRAEFQRAEKLIAPMGPQRFLQLVNTSGAGGPAGSAAALRGLLDALGGGGLAPLGEVPRHLRSEFDPQVRQQRQIHELDRHNQWLLSESPLVRKEFMAKLDTGSLEKYQASLQSYRTLFRDEIIGRFDLPLLPPNVRSRKAYENESWTGYEVVMDVFDEVIAYGVLLVPNDIKPGERRPVVVCQHGLEGRPTDTILGDHRAYHDFAAKLCERGFITFAPQNLYIFRDRFRSLQRKANPLKKTLFSIIVPQHQQITDWLASLPYVDRQRIAFYGLSYGGKSAMRIPPLVDNYCLSICSADFNEWVRKNASTQHPFSYVGTIEYEIFEFDLGGTFNYAEMAALICPRPFMVERGHFDGVGWDEWVAYEFAKVRNLYQARLGIGDRCEIEWFVGPHTINGQGTFDFLHKHLSWPKR